jgi:phenylacetyl-CoA:acceptor oxidoreductase subunit 1
MVVDLARCVGCQTCTIACKTENGLPPGTLWRTVLDMEGGEYPDVNRAFVPLTCMHCADPPCFDACPTTATRVRESGIVWIEQSLCIGCGSCVVACPYQARHLVPKQRYWFEAPTAPELATYDPARVGICTKCEFCFHRVGEAPDGAVPGRDPAYTPVCASSCIANAIVFGDFERPDSPVSRLLAKHGTGVRMLPHLGTDPSVVYLHPPRISGQALRPQHSWHALAVSNFFCGPAGAGLYALGVLWGWLVGGNTPVLRWAALEDSWANLSRGALTVPQWAGLLGPLLVGIGLLSVAAEAGRPLRGLNVLRNVRRAWMSRESAFALVFIALGGLNTLLWASPPLQAIAAAAGVGVVFSQGMILARAKGIPAWNVPLMPALFVTSALLTGAGALVLAAAAAGTLPLTQGPLAWLMLAAAAVDLALWGTYLRRKSPSRTFMAALARLRRGWAAWGNLGLGHAVPILLAALSLFTKAAWPLPLAAVAALTGGWLAKHALIQRAGLVVDLFEGFGRPAGLAEDTAAPAPPAAVKRHAA